MLRGILFIALGIFILWLPQDAIFDFVLYIGILALVSGVLLLFNAYRHWKRKHVLWSFQLLEAIFDIFLGGVILLYPFESAEAIITLFPIFIGFGLFFWGWFIILYSFRIEKMPLGQWKPLVIGGMVTIILAIIIIINSWFFPEADYEAAVIFVGATFIFYGFLYTLVGFRMKGKN